MTTSEEKWADMSSEDHGIHVLAWMDGTDNSRKALDNCEIEIAP